MLYRFGGSAHFVGIARSLAVVVLPLTLTACVDDDVLDRGTQESSTEEVIGETTAANGQRFLPVDSGTVEPATGDGTPLTVEAEAPEDADDIEGAEDVASPPQPRSGIHGSVDPEFAARLGWPVNGPRPVRGAIMPSNRIVCYYGNPNSTRMGALGEFPKEEMLERLREQVGEWRQADPSTPVKPCLHLIAVVAQEEEGTAGHYRAIMLDRTVEMVYDWAREIDGILFLDLQVGTDDIRNILPRFEWILRNPDVHLGIDPEFYMKDGTPPGRKIGTLDAADVNYAADFLADLVREHDLPPKVVVIHRFTQRMLTNYQDIQLRPEVQFVVHMDGWGAPWLKQDSYRDFIVREPVQYAGFKIFYNNDTRNGTPLMMPEDVLRLQPTPLYIQYQ